MKSSPSPFLRFTTAAVIACAASANAADYTWDGGTGNWDATNWNGATATGPTTAGNTATINSGTVTANVGGPGNLDSITIGSGGQLNFYNGDGGIYAYQGVGNLILQGGTVNGGSATYHAYGASLLGNVTVSGSAASTITGGSWFNINPTTTYTVADATGNSATDLLVSTSLRALPDSGNDNAYATAAIIKEGAGTMEVTVHSYFRGGLTLNGGTLKLSGGNGGYGFFDGAVTVNSGTTLETVSDGTGLGWQNGWKPSSVNINGGTITTAGTSHIWGISGGINMTGGTLQSNNGVSDANGPQLEWNYTNVTTNASVDTATIGGRIRIRSDGGYSGISFDVADGAATTDLLVSAAVTEASGGLGITKTGVGTVVLSGANNYTGATTASAGTLLITGSLGSSAVSVGSNATVGGSGTVGGTLSFGIDSFFDVFSAVVGNDPLAVTGTVSFGSGFGIDNLTGINWDSVAPGTYTLIDNTQDFSGAGLDNWEIGAAFPVAAGKSAYFTNGSLKLVVIPEPSTALLCGLGMLCLFRRRRA